MAEQQESEDGREDVEESLRNERKRRQECEQRVVEMEKKIQRMNEKNKEKEMREQEDDKKEEKQKVGLLLSLRNFPGFKCLMRKPKACVL